MAQYTHLPIFQLAYKLTLEIYQITHQFPREYKYTLGQKLKEISADFLDFIILANSQEDKLPSLKEARLRLERLRIHIRLACDLKIINLNRYESISRSLEDLSKQLSGWQEWSLKTEKRK
jgi:hypothetical protein